MARKFDFYSAYTGPALATKLITRYKQLEQDPTVLRTTIQTYYSCTSIGDRIEYSAILEYDTTE